MTVAFWDEGFSSSGWSPFCANSYENNVGSDALFVIGLHGSGDTIALFLQDWEVAKVVSTCHTALDMLCQDYTKLKGDVAGLVSERVLLLKGKEVNDRSF